jgi:hypothetical protein
LRGGGLAIAIEARHVRTRGKGVASESFVEGRFVGQELNPQNWK